MSPQHFDVIKLAEFQLACKWCEFENSTSDIMFKVEAKELILQILVFIHETECILIIVISFITGCNIEERIGLHACGFATEKIIIERSNRWYFDNIRNTRKNFIVSKRTPKHTWKSVRVFYVDNGVLATKACAVKC